MKTSYRDDQKERWQRTAQIVAWDQLLSDRPVGLRKVIYLDTREALQTIRLLQRGYRPENLLAVNFKAVEIALLTQKLDKLGLPRIPTRSGDFFLATEGVGQADIIDFDGCSNLSGEVGDVLLTQAVSNATPRILSFTILAAREDKKTTKELSKIAEWVTTPDRRTSSNQIVNPKHWPRLALAIAQACGVIHVDAEEVCHVTCLYHVEDLRWGVYRSTSNQPMAWASVRIIPHPRHNLRDRRNIKQILRWAKEGVIPCCTLEHSYEKVKMHDYDFMPTWTQQQFDYYHGIHKGKVSELSTKEFPSVDRRSIGWPVRKEKID